MNKGKSTKRSTLFINRDWYRFATDIQKDFKLLLLCFSILGCFRVLLIFLFRDHMSPNMGFYHLLVAVMNGARFDGVVAGYVTLLPLLVTIACGFFRLEKIANRTRMVMLLFFIWLSAFLFASNIMFIAEFKDNFNHLIFNIIYDDAKAIVQSAWADYPVVFYFSLAIGLSALLSYGGMCFIKTPFISRQRQQRIFSGNWQKVLATFFSILVLFFVFRGSMGSRPVQVKDAGVTPDPFLNKLVINPYTALDQTFQVQLELTGKSGLEKFLPDGNVRKAVDILFENKPAEPDIDSYIKKTASGISSQPPRHVFFIIEESLDSWSLLDQYQSFNLLPNFQQLGKEGVLLRAFLPASSGTMTSLAAILTGLPDVGVFTNYSPKAGKPFPSSLAPQFKKLGYETHFYYGGYLTWQRLHDFCLDQGFDHIHGGGEMGKWQLKEWGVDDHVLFDYISTQLNDERPTFNVILTTTNHSPYDVPVYEWGFPYHEMPEALKDQYDGNQPVPVFGHLWYADKVMGQFIRKTEQQLPLTLFAITGDHRSRKFINSRYTRYERLSVPLVLYGKSFIHPLALKTADAIAGSHMDIMPTLIELCAPKGFTYYSFGTNLLDPQRRQIGFGVNALITPNHLVEPKGAPEKLTFSSEKALDLNPDQEPNLLRAYYGVGWWRLVRGSQLP